MGAEVTVGGRGAEALYVDAVPGTMGVMQINVWIPAETGGGEAVPVVVRVTGGKATLSVAVRP